VIAFLSSYLQKLYSAFSIIMVLADQISDIILFGLLILQKEYEFAGKKAKSL
jgi:hypothetical protein